MQNQKVIERLGYSPNEAKVYLTSLALGEAHISDIAEKVGMPRTTVQTIAERLHDDGLMNFYVMRRYKYWVAEDPNVLLTMLRQREEIVTEAIPSLIALKEKARAATKTAKVQEQLGPLRDVAAGMLQPVLIANAESKIQFVNSSWAEQFGYSSDEVYDQHTRMLKSGKSPKEEYERMWSTLKAGRLFESDKIIDQKKDGTLFTLFTIIFPVRHGNRIFYVQILEERTPRAGESSNLKQQFQSVITT